MYTDFRFLEYFMGIYLLIIEKTDYYSGILSELGKKKCTRVHSSTY